MATAASVTMEGLNEALAALKAAGAASENLTQAYGGAADALLGASRPRTPFKTGQMRAASRSEGHPKFGLVIVDKPQAGMIHFGNATRGLGRKIGDVRGKKNKAAAVGLSARTGLSQATLRKASRLNTTRTKRTGAFTHAQRGGPIRPQPWIYEARDQGIEQIFDRFEAQTDGIEKAFG